MCGLYGSLRSSLSSLEQNEVLGLLSHRGPDQQDYWQNDKVYLGHTRLSIIDTSDAGKQPISDSESSTVITVNGEIYNFVELKSILEKDFTFKSSSDSEVVLYGYKKWGINGLAARLEGMFAIIIYDVIKNVIHLIRDRVGIKPLYYSTKNNSFVWGSELKVIREHFKQVTLEIDKTALYDFLTYQYIPAPKTVFIDVFKLPQAHLASFNLETKGLVLYKYWEPSLIDKPISIKNAQEKLMELLRDSIRMQLVSDVNVGYFLSGGIDSSTIVALSVMEDKSNPAICMGFDHASHDETYFAKCLSAHVNVPYLQEILSEDMLHDLQPLFTDWYDEPFADTSAFPTYLISKFSKKYASVILAGDGGDEIFGGYYWYKQFEYLSKRRKFERLRKRFADLLGLVNLPRDSLLGRIRNKIVREYCLSGLELYSCLLGGLLPFEKKYRIKFGIPDSYDDYWHFRKFYREDISLYKRLQYMDFCTYLPDDILTKVDRASMAASLEVRVPLLSTKLVEFSFSLPDDVRLVGGEMKGLLKHAIKDFVPRQIIDRPKKGFSVPESKWRAGIFDKRFSKQENILIEFDKRFKWNIL